MKKMNRVLSTLLAGLVCVSCTLPVQLTASAETTGVYEERLSYLIREDGTAEITDCVPDTSFEAHTEVIIPAEIDGAVVTSIGDEAFSDCTDIVGITLPDTIISIGDSAFDRCYQLRSVYYGDTHTQWQEIAVGEENEELHRAIFYYTSGSMIYSFQEDGTAMLTGHEAVTGSVVIPGEIEGVPLTRIDDRVFEDDFPGITDVTILEGITSIGYSAFYGCAGLKEVNLPDSLIVIEKCAFESCTALKSIVLPENLQRLESRAFLGCTYLGDITVPEGLTDIGKNAFSGRFLSTVRDESGMAIVNNIVVDGSLCSGDIVIPEHVTGITEYAFQEEPIESVTILGTLDHIGHHAFFGCDSLTKVTFAEGTVSLGEAMFSGCSALTDITLPESLTEISGSAFASCTALTEVPLHEGITSIGPSAFDSCSGLTELTLPASVSVIGNCAFANCGALLSVVLPEGLTAIPDQLFSECLKLKSIEIPESAASIGADAFKNTYWLKRKSASEPGNLVIINGILIEGKYSSDDVVIPDTVHTIGHNAFRDGQKAAAIQIPEGTTQIGSYAFSNCAVLESVSVPESVTFIDSRAFYGSESLTTIYYAGSEADWAKIEINQDNMNDLENITIIYGEETVYETGDLDGDGVITISDATEVLTIYARMAVQLDVSGYTESQLAAADVNQDGTVNIRDATAILTYYAQTAASLNPDWADIIG